MKYPKCQAEILDDSQFCSKCGTPIHPGDKAFLSHTHTILRPIDELVPGTELAGKYKIIDVVGKGGMGMMIDIPEEVIFDKIQVITNWVEELKRLVPAR